MIELRGYQHDAVAKIMQSPHRRTLLVVPTAGGKTTIANAIIHANPNRFVLFFAHRRELIHQPRDRIKKEFNIDAGVILSGHSADAMRRVQAASIQTLWSRCMLGDKPLPPADIVFVDEAHRTPAKTYRKILKRYPNAKIIGLTATPCRGDGRGLGNDYDQIIEVIDVETLTDLGFLVPTRVYAPSTPDLRGIRTQLGDYAIGELAERVDKPELVGDVVTHWHRLAGGRQTVVYATSVAHSIHLAEEFIKSGVKAAHIDGKTDKDERDDTLKKFATGDITVVCNNLVLTEGYDEPSIGCIVLARPTKHHGLFRQMCGRGLRIHPGKTDVLILDHAGLHFRHGFISDPVQWTLDPDKRASLPAQQARKASPGEMALLSCKECGAIRTAGKACDHCGYMPKRRGERLDVRDGDLAHLERNGKLQPNHYSVEDKQLFYRGCLAITMARGHKIGAAAYRYKERFNEFPPREWMQLGPIQPTLEVSAWDRHCRIKYVKSMQKAQANG